MGQEQVIKFLERHKNKEFTTTELTKFLNLGINSIKVNLRSLLKDPFVKIIRRPLSSKEKIKKYQKQESNRVINAQIFVYKLVE